MISEAPLALLLITGPLEQPQTQPWLLTLRTPGADYELAAGLLFSEGLIQTASDILKMSYCVGPDKSQQTYNQLQIRLRPGLQPDLSSQQRWGASTTACGLCGKVALAQLMQELPVLPPAGQDWQVSAEVFYALLERLRAAQKLFARTGGVHAAGLFDRSGKLLDLAEDLGRHNALDKLIGARLLQGQLDLHQCILLLSGRPSFEMIQKALRARIPVVAAVGAPSSLAVDLARDGGQTLLGFLKSDGFNLYCGAERLC
ncbi:MAG: formate dehydrogenase accessory sulfurtransferase FdhD [Candidatus Sericytochromatia bacterium]|nr:formate dehydrogenase accessory sulfurtransferase FdhD [Candidatus Sericytochromatia bacterium]